LRQLAAQLERRDAPRLLMLFIVVATGAAGLLASALLRHLGVRLMPVRYLLALACAYAVFLFLVWLWLLYRRREVDLANVDAPDLSGADGPPCEAGAPDVPSGGGGSGGGGFDLGFDEGIVILAVVLAVGCAVLAALWLIWTAPALLSELLLDGVLGAALYRRLRRLDRRHWLESAVSRTIVPVGITAAFFVVAGGLLHLYAPEATTIGEAWRHYVESARR
jgi:hypothetical protein